MAFGAVMLIGACGLPKATAQSSGCAQADTVRVPHRLDYLKQMVSSSDPDHTATRQTLGLAVLSPSKVSLVTKASTCQSGVTAMNTVRQQPGAVRRVWIFALGDGGHAVGDPALDSLAGDGVMYFFDKSFTHKLTLYGF
jgi:hypothetical protein